MTADRAGAIAGGIRSSGEEPGAVLDACARFRIPGELVEVEARKIGHIHRSYVVTSAHGRRRSRYLLQRINTDVFVDPRALMANIALVTDHIRKRSPESGSLRIVRAVDGDLAWFGEAGCWRCYEHLEGCRSTEAVAKPSDARGAGQAFGQFEALLVDLDPALLADTIPGFHHVGRRLQQLDAAVADDACARSKTSARELAAVDEHRDLADVAEHAGSQLPKRVVHNDSKISNVLFDQADGRPRCVVDLDTVMSGTVVWDFGDLMRSVSCQAPEDEPDLARVEANLDLIGEAAHGYLSEASVFLTEEERASLPVAGALATYEQAVRFLADYLAGDVYFKTAHPAHNLVRARSQLALLESLLSHQDEIEAAVERAWAALTGVG